VKGVRVLSMGRDGTSSGFSQTSDGIRLVLDFFLNDSTSEIISYVEVIDQLRRHAFKNGMNTEEKMHMDSHA
jgi:hypothetical protein